jgi:hypothetical protein
LYPGGAASHGSLPHGSSMSARQDSGMAAGLEQGPTDMDAMTINDDPDTAIPSNNVQLLLDRKRKSSHKKKLHTSRRPPPAKKARVASTTNDNAPIVFAPRPPSHDSGTARWRWQDDILADDNWTAAERAQLEASWHHDDTTESGLLKGPPSRLLGSLRDLGRFHYYHQLAADHTGSSVQQKQLYAELEATLTTKQRRRRQREAVSVRLGDHRALEKEKAPVSKTRTMAPSSSRVLRTMEISNGADTSLEDGNARYWMDLDLGHCLLEGVVSMDGTADRRMLYAFGNIELLLLDEDA